jgi:hypothetical protein
MLFHATGGCKYVKVALGGGLSKLLATAPDTQMTRNPGNLAGGSGPESGPPRAPLLVKRPKTGNLPTCSVNLMRMLRQVQGQLRTAQDSTATAQGCLLMGSG